MSATTEHERWTRGLAARYGATKAELSRPQNNAPTLLHGSAIPASQPEFEEALNDTARVVAMLRDGSFKDFVKGYVQASAKADPDILAQVRDETQRGLTSWLKEQEEKNAAAASINLSWDEPVGNRRARRVKASRYNPKALGARLDGEFEDTSDFLRYAWDRNTTPENVARRMKIQNSFGSTVPSDGGFLIPERLRAELLRVAVESAIMRQGARTIPMDSLRVPFPTIDSTSNATSIHGGVVAYWTPEGGTLTESQARFGRVVLEAKKLTAYADVPAELLQDSIISLAALIEELFPEAIAWFEDVAFLRGTGVGEPLGILDAGNTAMISVAKESGQAADTIVLQNILKMYARMLPSSLGRAVWTVPPGAFTELATMALDVGTGGSAVWLTNAADGPPMTILGRPVIVTEKVPKLGDAMDIGFIDRGYYLIGDRQEMRAASSTEYRFGNDEVSYRVIERVDGAPWIKSAITPRNGGDTLSPFVTLAERA